MKVVRKNCFDLQSALRYAFELQLRVATLSLMTWRPKLHATLVDTVARRIIPRLESLVPLRFSNRFTAFFYAPN